MLVLDVIGVLEDGSLPRDPSVPLNPRRPLQVPLASSLTINARILKPNGSPVNLTGGSLTFTLKKKFSDQQPIVSRLGTLTAAAAGQASFQLVPVETKDLTPGHFVWDVWFTDSAGNRNAVIPTSPFVLEPAVTLPGQLANVPFFPPPPPVVATGWLSITDISVVGGTASNKVYDDPPNNTILQGATVSGLNLLVSVKSSAPKVTVGGVPATLPQDPGGGFYSGQVAVTVTGSTSILAQLTTPDGQPGATDTTTVTYQAPPSITALQFIGSYPGAQTELKAGDTFQVQGTTSAPAVGVEVQDFGAGILQTINFASTTNFTVTITIADRGTSPQSLVARLRAKDANSAFGPTADTSNTVVLNNLYPTVTFGAKTYPVGQQALKNAETADVAITTANLDSILYDSPNGDLSIAAPTVIASPKTVTRIAGSYNVATNNLRGTATRNANGAVTVSQTVVNIANVAPTIDITVPAARLRSGGNDGTAAQNHTVSILSDQQLLNAPSMNAGAGGGTFQGGGFTGGPTAWVRTLQVHDNDTKGNYSFSTLVATGLSGLVQNTINSGAAYTLGGFVQRTLTFAAFSQNTTLNVGVVTYAKLQAGIFTSTNQPALRNAVQGDVSNIANTYTVLTLGNVGPITLFWNDSAAASANSSGTAQITAVEEVV